MIDWSKTRVLLVHSDIHMRRWAHEILHKQKVASAQSTRSPATGLALLKRFAADVAVVQLLHPEMTAVDFLRQVRDAARSPNPNLPVVAVADSAQSDLQQAAEAAGIADIIPRQIPPEQFLERVAAAIAAPRRSGKTATPARRPAAPSAGGPLVGPARERSGAGQAIETLEAKAESRPSVPLVDTPPPAAARRSAEDWAQAVAAPETSVAQEPESDISPILGEHVAWLQSRGSRGKRANLDKADLHGQSLQQANLASASLREADLSDADCRQATFTSADLRRADLSGADLSGANLSVANLRGAKLRLSKLSEASLRGADLAGACLTDAALAATDFAGANLLDTDLRRSDLTWATGLTQAQVDKARADGSTRMPLGIRTPEFDE